MLISHLLRFSLAPLLLASSLAFAATPPSASLLPADTVGYVSVANPSDLGERWERTQFGQFCQEPALDPFIESVEEQLFRKLGNLDERLGVKFDDLKGIAGGELAWGLVDRQQQRAAAVLMVDTSGNGEARDALIARIEAHLKTRRATRSEAEVAGVKLVRHSIPSQEAGGAPTHASYFIHQELFCVADNAALADLIATRLTQAAQDAGSLAAVKGYVEVMTRAEAASQGLSPDMRWYTDPFRFVDTARTRNETRSEAAETRSRQIREQGFDAIQALGGFVHVSPNPAHDFIHRTVVYAPPQQGAPQGKKYRLAMNMLTMPNRADLDLHAWTPRTLARYTTVNIDLLTAFDHVGTLFDEFAGYEGAFDTAMEGYETDPFGPKINVRNEIIAALGTRVTIMTDYSLPIKVDSERFLAAIEVKPEKVDSLKVAIGKYLETDGFIQKQVDGHDVWEFEPEEELTSAGAGLIPDAEQESDTRLLTRSAVCVFDNNLMIASDVEFLRLAFQSPPQPEALEASYDQQEIAEVLRQIAPQERASWSFQRTDEALRPTYELLRAGKMPEAETFFGRLLNELLTSPEDQKNQLLRKQKLDGDELPSFEMVRRYFGPAGRIIRSDADGWLITGVILNKAVE